MKFTLALCILTAVAACGPQSSRGVSIEAYGATSRTGDIKVIGVVGEASWSGQFTPAVMTFSADGTTVALARGSTIVVRRFDSGVELGRLHAPDFAASLAITTDGVILAGGDDGRLVRWKPGGPARVIASLGSSISKLQTRRGLAACLTEDGVAHVVELPSGAQRWASEKGAIAIGLGRTALAVSYGSKIVVWSPTGKLTRRDVPKQVGAIVGLLGTDRGLTSSGVWDTSTWKKLANLPDWHKRGLLLHQSPESAVIVLPKSLVLVAAKDSGVSVTNRPGKYGATSKLAADARLNRTLVVFGNGVIERAIGGKLLTDPGVFVAGAWDPFRKVHLRVEWDLRSGSRWDYQIVEYGEAGRKIVGRVRELFDFEYSAGYWVARAAGNALLVRQGSRSEWRRLRVPTSGRLSYVALANGLCFAGTDQGRALIWDLRTKELIRSRQVFQRRIHRLAPSRDGMLCAYAQAGKKWDRFKWEVHGLFGEPVKVPGSHRLARWTYDAQRLALYHPEHGISVFNHRRQSLSESVRLEGEPKDDPHRFMATVRGSILLGSEFGRILQVRDDGVVLDAIRLDSPLTSLVTVSSNRVFATVESGFGVLLEVSSR